MTPSKPATREPHAQGQEPARFPIVGIGASAGGLEAFEQFFRACPTDSGMAFVLIPHLDPSHASLLSEILQRSTTLPVQEAQDQLAVQPDHVYIIPPNRDMGIFHGKLQISLPEMPRGLRLPIDAFLRSLGEDQGELAVGIVLSGLGTDGTLGLRTILGCGGLTLAQDPATAHYDGMPSSAIKAGYAAQVLPADKMPAALLATLRTRFQCQGSAVRTGAAAQQPPAPLPAGGMTRLLMMLRTATGHDFSLYRQSTIGRRVERRMAQHELTDLEVYLRYLKENPAELRLLFKELLINVTSFFRDPEAFACLEKEILPALLANKPEGYVFRTWVAGCASGEEAYSIAILLREQMEEQLASHAQFFSVQIYATDLDDDAIASARAGFYPPNIAADITPERLRRYFAAEEGGYRVKKEIRELVVFATQNVIMDPPFTRLDLLSCRNLMIYLEPELQSRLIPAFHFALKPGGVLFLSSSESIGNHTELFSPINRKWKLYRAEHATAAARALLHGGLAWTGTDSRAPAPPTEPPRQVNYAQLATKALLQTYAPASVLTDGHGNILYVHGETGKYLRPAPGQASLNLVDMAREGLPHELRSALQGASGQDAATLGREVSVKTNGEFELVSLSVRPVTTLGQPGLLLVSFQEVAGKTGRQAPVGKAKPAKRSAATAASTRIEQLELELAQARENLQITLEEQQASSEELKSGTEELQSANEELQSINEELETAKEELQSLNEEMVTVNGELQSKIEQMTVAQNDMKNLLDNISTGTIFLDQHLFIRRFTRDATLAYRLASGDVGRPLADIKSQLLGDDLLVHAQAVLDTLVPWEQEVRTASGTWLLTRILPYRTLDNYIDGVVMTFTDIGPRIEAVALQAARDLAEAVIDGIRDALVVLDGALVVISANRSYFREFKATAEETLGRPIDALNSGPWILPDLRERLHNVLALNQPLDDLVVDHDFPLIGRRRLRLNARRIVGKLGTPHLVLLTMQQDNG